MKANEWKGHCLTCNKDFQFKDGFTCPETGGRHEVAQKTYYHLGGRSVTDPRTRRMWAPTLTLRIGEEVKDAQGIIHIQHGGLYVHFSQSGIYITSNPEEQFYLETKYDLPNGPEGLKLWNQVYLTPEQQKNVVEAELAELQRKIKESNSLLEATKAQAEMQAAKVKRA